MKTKIILLLCLVGFGCLAESWTQTFTVTNSVAAASTNTVASSAIELGGIKSINVGIINIGVTNAAGTSVGAGASVVKLEGSYDGVTYFTHPTDTNYTVSVTAARDATNYGMVTIDTTPFLYLRVKSVGNSLTNAILTNTAVKIWTK